MAECEEVVQPFIKLDDNEPDKFHFRIAITIPELQTKRQYGFLGKVKEAEGESVNCNFTDRSVHVRVEIKKKIKKIYEHKQSKLPEEIIPEKSSYKLEQGLVLVYLRKVEPTSWEGYMDDMMLG